MDEFFSQVFGSRWHETLKPALLQPSKKVYITRRVGESSGLEISDVPVGHAYALDRASLEPVFALELKANQRFLDLCAAPGGKSLVALFYSQLKIQTRLNDSSKDRVKRLKAVMYDFLSEDEVRQLHMTCGDGSRIGQREPESYDRVLADVPCSAERHHLQDGDEGKWTLSSSKRLVVRQHALLCSALDATCAGGRVVYSTCSLSPLENDGVINKLKKSRKGQFQIFPTSQSMGELTEHGKILLPDRCQGFGPIYYAVLEKN